MCKIDPFADCLSHVPPDDFLNVTSSSSASDVSRLFRKRSRELHPDKNPERKDAQERYSLLSVIAEILRDDDKRKKYHVRFPWLSEAAKGGDSTFTKSGVLISISIIM